MNREERLAAGRVIGGVMRNQGVSRSELAQRLETHGIDVSLKTISNMTNGRHAASIDLIQASEAVLGISLERLATKEPASIVRDYPVAYGMADAIARLVLIEAEDGRLDAERIEQFRALLDEAGRA